MMRWWHQTLAFVRCNLVRCSRGLARLWRMRSRNSRLPQPVTPPHEQTTLCFNSDDVGKRPTDTRPSASVRVVVTMATDEQRLAALFQQYSRGKAPDVARVPTE